VIKSKDERAEKKNSFFEGRSFLKKEETLDNDQRGVEKKGESSGQQSEPFSFQVHIHTSVLVQR
jgi:hypothetical protein